MKREERTDISLPFQDSYETVKHAPLTSAEERVALPERRRGADDQHLEDLNFQRQCGFPPLLPHAGSCCLSEIETDTVTSPHQERPPFLFVSAGREHVAAEFLQTNRHNDNTMPYI